MSGISTTKKKAKDQFFNSITIQTTTPIDTIYINKYQNKKNKKSAKQPSQLSNKIKILQHLLQKKKY